MPETVLETAVVVLAKEAKKVAEVVGLAVVASQVQSSDSEVINSGSQTLKSGQALVLVRTQP